VPFCPRRCHYCDFYSVPDLDKAPLYLKGLALEAAAAASGGTWQGSFGSLYLGGGSPGALPEEALRELFRSLARFPLAEGAEATLEANPQDVTAGSLRLWRSLGITRISLGAQSFSREGLKSSLGRLHGPEEALRAAEAILKASFSLSLDLIYGWSGQTLAAWEADLRRAASGGACHVSAYSLTVAAGTGLARLLAEGALAPLPGEDALAELFLAAGEILGGSGLFRYEVSNFARPGRECRHNLGYWRRAPYLGLGPSAHSFDGRSRWGNLASLSGWALALKGGRAPVSFRENLGPSEERLESVMLGLRLSEGLEARALEGSPALPGLIRDGLLVRRGFRLAPTERGLLAADYLARTLA
jgi:oxygen-independent coproporphyrinogen-3 oxidase